MNAIINGILLLPDTIITDHALLYDDTIVGILPMAEVPDDATLIDAHGGYVAPGLIDLHIHGYGGVDVCEGDVAGLRQMSRALLKEGVTGWLATTMTVEESHLRHAFDACRQVMADSSTTLLGVHAEGPYIHPKRCGAQDVACVQTPNPYLIKEYADILRLVTLAPEMDDSFATIRTIKRETDISLSMGHTNADYATAMAAVDAGITHVTHLFNAMPPLHHREPGTVGAALTAAVSCELIADNHHVHPALYEWVYRQKRRQLCLITDCLSAAGTADGKGTLGGHPITVQEGVCRLPDGTLAGSTLRLYEAVWNLHTNTAIPLWECVNCATLNPASVLGLSHRKGSLEQGKDADILITDAHFRPITTILGGIMQ